MSDIGQEGLVIGNPGQQVSKAEIHTSGDFTVNSGGTPKLTVTPAGVVTAQAQVTAPLVNGAAGTFGTLSATSKSFDIKHPSRDDMRLRYACLEGPENGVYVRGRVKNYWSKAQYIDLPAVWADLVDPESITAHVTRIGSGGLWIDEIHTNWIRLGASDVMWGVEYTYLVMATRKDIPPLITEYPSQE